MNLMLIWLSVKIHHGVGPWQVCCKQNGISVLSRVDQYNSSTSAYRDNLPGCLSLQGGELHAHLYVQIPNLWSLKQHKQMRTANLEAVSINKKSARLPDCVQMWRWDIQSDWKHRVNCFTCTTYTRHIRIRSGQPSSILSLHPHDWVKTSVEFN